MRVIKADVIHQLEEAGFEVDAEEPVLEGQDGKVQEAV